MQPTLKQSTDTNLRMIQVLEVTVEDVTVAITHILKYIKENRLTINAKIGNLSKK